MQRLARIALASLALAVAAPAAAQYTFPQAGQQPQPIQPIQIWNNVVRVNVGVGFYNSGWANCYYGWYYGTCTSGSYGSYIPFMVGPQVDLHLTGMSGLSFGFLVGFGNVSATWYDQFN